MPEKKGYTPGHWLVHEWGKKYQVVEAQFRAKVAPGITMVGQHILAKEIDKKANAHLMAAAPDIYEALKAYQAANRLHNDSESELFDRAEKALAKAEGKE